MAWWVPQSLNHFFRIATWLAVSVPTATVIMYTDQLVLPRLLKIDRRMAAVPAWNQVARGNWPAITALLLGVGFGAWTSGVLPWQDGNPYPGWGIGPFEGWLLAGAAYILLAAAANRSKHRMSLLGFPATALLADPEPAVPTLSHAEGWSE